MRRQLVTSVVMFALVSLVAPARGQSAFQQLEDQVRRSTNGQGGPAATGQPAPVTPPGQEPGYLGLIADDRQTSRNGVSIVETVTDGPAAKSGLKMGDMITSVDNQPVRTMQEFASVLGKGQPGSKMVFQVRRGTETMNFEVTLGRRPPPGQRRFDQFGPIPADSNQTPAPRTGMLGVQIATITPEVQRNLNLQSPSGALIVGVVEGSPAAAAGIRQGSVIISVNGQRVNDPTDLTTLITAAGAGREVTLAVVYEGAVAERKVTLGDPAPALPTSETPPTFLPPAPSGAVPMSSESRLQSLEQRVEQLEQRVRELEAQLKAPALGTPKPSPGPQGT